MKITVLLLVVISGTFMPLGIQCTPLPQEKKTPFKSDNFRKLQPTTRGSNEIYFVPLLGLLGCIFKETSTLRFYHNGLKGRLCSTI